MSRHPFWTLLDQIQMDHRQLGAKIVELRAQAASLDLPTGKLEHRCRCGQTFRSNPQLEEHTYLVHNGPLPTHYAIADTLAGESQ